MFEAKYWRRHPGPGRRTASPAHSTIEALRAVTALWIVIAHCMIWGGWYWAPLPSAKFAVDLFMTVSDFLMVAQADTRAAIEPLLGVRNRWRFCALRYFRLVPAYYLSLLLAVVAAPLLLGGYNALRAANPMQWQFDTTYDPAGIEYSPHEPVHARDVHVRAAAGLEPESGVQFYVAFPAPLLALNHWSSARCSAQA